jgi:hypothetical protein
MRYLVRARVKPGCEWSLLRAIEDGTLGQGSVAEGEYLRNMQQARLCHDETAHWVEVCYCPTPLQEERRMRMIAAVAATTTVLNRGLAVTVIAPNVWRANSKLRGNRFSNHSATL